VCSNRISSFQGREGRTERPIAPSQRALSSPTSALAKLVIRTRGSIPETKVDTGAPTGRKRGACRTWRLAHWRSFTKEKTYQGQGEPSSKKGTSFSKRAQATSSGRIKDSLFGRDRPQPERNGIRGNKCDSDWKSTSGTARESKVYWAGGELPSEI